MNCRRLLVIPLGRLSSKISEPPALSRENYHFWFGRIDGIHLPEGMGGSLSEDEKARANRIEFTTLRSRFLESRGLLRLILSRYAGVEPESLSFRYGSRGKPYLKDDDALQSLRFSTSDCGPYWACAVASGQDVGVDLERIRPFAGMNRFVKHYFSTHEKKFFQSLDSLTRVRSFFEMWTAKEAYLKGTGDGVNLNLGEISTVPAPNGSFEIEIFSNGCWERTPWKICQIEPESGVVASLALQEEPCEVQFLSLAEAISPREGV
jgi:4'-phosphopantetheinyl transferase